jgi:hypothetical protein
MTKQQLQNIWNDYLLQINEGEDEQYLTDKFSDMLIDNNLTWETLWD